MDSSQDNLVLYDDGHGYCFAGHGYFSECQVNNLNISLDKQETLVYPIILTKSNTNSNTPSEHRVPLKVEQSSITLINNTKSNTKGYTKGKTKDEKIKSMTKQFINYRGLTKSTLRKYNSSFIVDGNGLPLHIEFPYSDTAFKARSYDKKEFWTVGDTSEYPLFGSKVFSLGEARSVTITEGEIDALSVYQMLGNYPCVSVRSSSSAKNDCKKMYDFLDSFDKIYLCLDMDEPGQKATREIAKMFPLNKIYIVKMNLFKDANDYLTHGKEKEFKSTWWAAKRNTPDNIVSSNKDIESILKQEKKSVIATYPFPSLEEKLMSIRSGEMILFTALEKHGKTEIFRAIEHHLLKTTDYNLGIIHLEEQEKRTIQGLITYEIENPVHLPTSSVEPNEQFEAYKRLVGEKDDRVHFYKHFGSDDIDKIINTIRYLVVGAECKFVFLDHITMLVTGMEDGDERRTLDTLSTKLSALTRELDFTLFMISHVNDDGLTRGSRNISKVADVVVHIDRDIINADDIIRNTTNVMVKANRFSGLTGPSGKLYFDVEKYVMNEITSEELERLQQEQVALPF